MDILIVDDIAENRCLLEALFEGAGYGVVSAHNGQQALEHLRNKAVDLIVSDILMPVMDGFHLCRECKTNPAWRNIPFVFYTATYTEKKDEAFAMALGADRFVIKPQEPERLLAITKVILESSVARKGAAEPPMDDQAYFTLYNERVARKLEKKIAEMAKLNLALRESEKKYRLLAENIQDVIFVLNMDLNYTYVSPSVKLLLGYESEEVMKQPASETVTSVSWNLVVNTFSEAMAFEKAGQGDIHRSRTIVLEMRHKNGTAVWTEVKASFIWDENNRPTGVIGVTREITERRQAEAEREKLQAQLNHAQRLESVGRLAGGVAHDFNNMLNIIGGYSELAKSNLSASDPIYGYLQEVISAANRSAAIVRQLLAFARKQVTVPEVINLNDAVEDMLKMIRRLIGEDINLVWRPQTNLWHTKIDPSQIDQLLANLCVNARDAIDGHGTIIVETHNENFDERYCDAHRWVSPGDYAAISIGDNGCGMDQHTQEQIFEPFFTTKELGKGTGLGLSTVYGIVKQNNGLIHVCSEPGHGTTFKLYFPRFEAEPDVIVTDAPVKIPYGMGETVLVVEDEKTVLKLAEVILQDLGYLVLTANLPAEAIKIVQNHLPKTIHLLLTDVIMPDMNGNQLNDAILSLCPTIKTLFMSGYSFDTIACKGILPEQVNYIQKPFSARSLALKVREILDRK
jgi:PAS domain S-box-containing protein